MSRFYEEETFSTKEQQEQRQQHFGNGGENTHDDIFMGGSNATIDSDQVVEIQIMGASSENLHRQGLEEQEQPRRISSPEIYGKKVTFGGNESSGVSNSDTEEEKQETNINGESKQITDEKSMEGVEALKIPDKKSSRTKKSKGRRTHSKKPNHLSVESHKLERKLNKKAANSTNTPHSLISPMSSHAFHFMMNAPTPMLDHHNATTVDNDERTSISETPSTIGSPTDELKSDNESFGGNTPSLPMPSVFETEKKYEELPTPTSGTDLILNENGPNIGRNIRDILKGLPSFEDAGKRFIIVGLGYECHRFDCAKTMLDHITGEDQDAESFWIDCQQSTAEDIHTLQKYFGIHALTAEDCINNDSGEKWEVFDNYMFMVFTGQIADKVASNEYLPCHLNVLIFENCIVTIHDKPIEGMDLLMSRIEKEFEIDAKHRKKLKAGKSIREKRDIIEKIRSESTPRQNDNAEVIRRRKSTTIPSPSWVFYAYLDAIIDVYIPKVDNLTRECDTLDEFTVSLNTTEKEDLLWRIALNKRRTIVLRKLLLPKQKMITYLVSSRVPLPFIDKEIQLYLRDVLDHLTYCCDRLDIARDSLHQSHTNYLTRVQIEIAQNAQKTDAFMNRLTVFASIFGPLSVLSGIWGMNVKVPGQDADSLYWFFGICAFMVILSLALVMLLRRQLVSM